MSLPPRIAAAADRSEHVRDALAVARDAHAGQIRNGSGGMPYIDHPIAVAELLAEHGYGDDVLAAALLHDVVEESEVEVDELRERFGGRVADLVEALTDDIEIDDYESRKEVHRRHVEAVGADALAIYAADKLTNIRALRRVYATQGEAVGEELKAPLDVKVAVWEADFVLLSSAAPDLAFLSDLTDQLAGLRSDRQAVATPKTPAP